ncbi:hypothetical protein MSG28_014258 [Choristoneura fumiferana]|uniref:Uncharacterized protein n=1 Tax=Choristoneura fumiferana TaxID=7141 RepID=A0ACC0JGI2_CHOFU|nr:hypothetical protein MSG28_014258 [Choristoneura fumiferana]
MNFARVLFFVFACVVALSAVSGAPNPRNELARIFATASSKLLQRSQSSAKQQPLLKDKRPLTPTSPEEMTVTPLFLSSTIYAPKVDYNDEKTINQ